MIFGPAFMAAWAVVKRIATAIPWWAWLAFALLFAGWLYGERKEAQGRREVQAEFDAYKAAQAAEAEQQRKISAERAKADQAKSDAIGAKRESDHSSNRLAESQLVADLRSGNRKLRHDLQACLSAPPDTAGVPGGPVHSDPLRGGDAPDMAGAVGGSIYLADDADSRHARLIEYVELLQATCSAN